MTKDDIRWVQSYTGKKIDLLDPQPKDISLIDIAWGVSGKVRYNCQSNQRYTVMEHSLLVYKFCIINPLEGLFHDAAEAYLPDVPSPLKNMDCFEEFRKIEDNLLKVIFDKYSLQYPLSNEVEYVDEKICSNEQPLFMPDPPESWQLRYPPFDLTPFPRLTEMEAAFAFLRICERNNIR